MWISRGICAKIRNLLLASAQFVDVFRERNLFGFLDEFNHVLEQRQRHLAKILNILAYIPCSWFPTLQSCRRNCIILSGWTNLWNQQRVYVRLMFHNLIKILVYTNDQNLLIKGILRIVVSKTELIEWFGTIMVYNASKDSIVLLKFLEFCLKLLSLFRIVFPFDNLKGRFFVGGLLCGPELRRHVVKNEGVMSVERE